MDHLLKRESKSIDISDSDPIGRKKLGKQTDIETLIPDRKARGSGSRLFDARFMDTV
jgi:hypothetical protein